ncbi:hypothetical protein ACFQE5_20345 [Pseudonocardia hispaniensis]|uniref:Uncharacterized protein n=1 Tax=Pseudonocardia hispaniensis TaxID=904933 RepID=A0ABW1J819_9PSEU
MWATRTATLGTVVLDGNGRVLDRCDADTNNPPTSRCAGECTHRWVPVVVRGHAVGRESQALNPVRPGTAHIRLDVARSRR